MSPVRLEPLALVHVPALERLLGDPEILRFTRIPDPPPAGFAAAWVARYDHGRAEGTSEAFAALDGDGTFVGLGLAPNVDRTAREAELGYLVTPAARGRGWATEILRRLTEWAFDEAEIVRAYLVIDVENTASLRVAERCGYAREGVMRSLHLKGERRIDAALYARVR